MLVGCGGGNGDAGPRTAGPGTGTADAGPPLHVPPGLVARGRAARGWRSLPGALRGDEIGAASLGRGAVGVVFANDSGNDPCAWIPFARRLASAGFRPAVFSYGSAGAPRELLGVATALRRSGVRAVALVGASLGGRAVLQAASGPGPAAGLSGVVSLSGERKLGPRYPDLLPVVRRVRRPVLFVSSRGDGYTDFGADTRLFHRVAPARVDRLLLVGGDAHGTDLLAGRPGPRVRAGILSFLRSVGERR